MIDACRYLTEDGFAIFLFHGIIRNRRESVRNYTRKHLPVDEFVRAVEELTRVGSPVSMPAVVTATHGGPPIPGRAFCITFDDGFENNYSVAAPILAGLGIPATFYVATDFVDRNSVSWIDAIEYAFERVPSFHLTHPESGVHVYVDSVAEKVRLLDDIRRFVKSSPEIDPYDYAFGLCEALGIDSVEPDPELDQKMSWSQVRELAACSDFTIGGHSHTHRVLDYLDDESLQREIDTSLSLLRSHLGMSIDHYSYPEGTASSYSERVVSLLRTRGIVCAPTAEEGTNRVGDDLFRLKRVMVA